MFDIVLDLILEGFNLMSWYIPVLLVCGIIAHMCKESR